MPEDICGGDGSLRYICTLSIGFTLIYAAIAFISALVAVVIKRANALKYILFVILSVLACFYFTDIAMKRLQDPLRFGIEWFTILYYFWCFIISCLLILVLSYRNRTIGLFVAAAIITLIFTAVFAWTGRGNVEHITPLAGGLFRSFSFGFLWLADSFRLFCLMTIFWVIWSLFAILINWMRTGNTGLREILNTARILPVILIIMAIPVLSIPAGEHFNRKDVAEAKSYIEEAKKKADRYFYENGEYPKFIEEMLPEGNPRLLQRHEFFTYGVRGTYYFSHEKKYCFLFQNPTRKFGYYSITSDRDWRYNKERGGYDDVFTSLCDESMQTYDDLIAGHLGVRKDSSAVDRLIDEVGLSKNQPLSAPISKRASELLQQKIEEESKNNPGIKGLLKQPKE